MGCDVMEDRLLCCCCGPFSCGPFNAPVLIVPVLDENFPSFTTSFLPDRELCQFILKVYSFCLNGSI